MGLNISKMSSRILLAAASAVILVAGISYWVHNQDYIGTDNGYVNANVVQIASRVTGQVTHLYVTNNQFVKQGQALLAVDPEPFIIAITKAKAQLAIEQANWKNAQLNAERTLSLVKNKNLPMQAGDDAQAKLQGAVAAVELAKASLAQAELNYKYTQITAPTTGWITNMSIREGNSVQANQPLFALIGHREFWVDANFKETELAKIRPGQKAVIAVDMYPQHTFKGIVESIGGGTGAAFSLLPPQNATGNWVKVTQRVPVRVHVVEPTKQYPLRIGTTATVTVDTRSSTLRAS